MDQIHKVKTDDKMYEHAYLIQVKMGILFLKFLKTHPDYAAFSKANPNEGKNGLKCPTAIWMIGRGCDCYGRYLEMPQKAFERGILYERA